jgi:hypothetical protein
MNPIRAIRHLAGILAGQATVVLASLTTAPAALAAPRPRPPGWNKHPPRPDPARVHAVLAGGIPGWQLTLMVVTVVLLTVTLVAIVYPGPGRAVASERTHRLSDDGFRRCADPKGQPAASASPAPNRLRPLNRSQPGKNRSP